MFEITFANTRFGTGTILIHGIAKGRSTSVGYLAEKAA